MIVAWALVNYWQRGRGRGAMANIISHVSPPEPEMLFSLQVSDLRQSDIYLGYTPRRIRFAELYKSKRRGRPGCSCCATRPQRYQRRALAVLEVVLQLLPPATATPACGQT